MLRLRSGIESDFLDFNERDGWGRRRNCGKQRLRNGHVRWSPWAGETSKPGSSLASHPSLPQTPNDSLLKRSFTNIWRERNTKHVHIYLFFVHSTHDKYHQTKSQFEMHHVIDPKRENLQQKKSTKL